MREGLYRLFLEDILVSINKIEICMAEMTDEISEENNLVGDMVVEKLGDIVEATKNIPVDLKRSNPDLPWAEMIALEGMMTLAYTGKLPKIKGKVETIITNLST